jgi:L-iditol 2-dehydrogenase
MRAALMRSPGELEVTEVENPRCPPGGALLKVLACAVCGTDVKMLRNGHRDLAYPRIPGHEVTAEVVEMNAASSELAPGDRVQVWPGEACGRCRYCLSERDQLCPHIRIMGFNMDGGMAEQVTVEGLSRLVPIGDADPLHLTLAEPLACALNAQVKTGVGPEDTVLILGGGPMGCINAALARYRGADKVLMTEADPRRLEVAPTGLFDRRSLPDHSSVREMVLSETQGVGADVLIPCTPNVRLDRDLLSLLAPGGRLCVFSGPRKEDSPIPVDMREVHYRELTLAGSYGQSSRQDRWAVDMLRHGELDLRWMLTATFPLERAKEAFEQASSLRGMKAVITV